MVRARARCIFGICCIGIKGAATGVRLFGCCSSSGITCRRDFADGTWGAAIATLCCSSPLACLDAATLAAGWPSITTPPK